LGRWHLAALFLAESRFETIRCHSCGPVHGELAVFDVPDGGISVPRVIHLSGMQLPAHPSDNVAKPAVRGLIISHRGQTIAVSMIGDENGKARIICFMDLQALSPEHRTVRSN
jgi:hypothetical protein